MHFFQGLKIKIYCCVNNYKSFPNVCLRAHTLKVLNFIPGKNVNKQCVVVDYDNFSLQRKSDL